MDKLDVLPHCAGPWLRNMQMASTLFGSPENQQFGAFPVSPRPLPNLHSSQPHVSSLAKCHHEHPSALPPSPGKTPMRTTIISRLLLALWNWKDNKAIIDMRKHRITNDREGSTCASLFWTSSGFLSSCGVSCHCFLDRHEILIDIVSYGISRREDDPESSR